MSDTVIRVENLSKLYRLGEVSTGTISHDLNRWWHQVRGKEDPYALIGQVNDRTKKAEREYSWALKDVNFEVKQGEVLGIIGRNGAGKSTLLKILSRVTAPTSGNIKIKGRIVSLLEVGTGFHPELTGRENIFLNGAILGMRRGEILSKLDEIIDFSGCVAYLDTPVKRYSSGMVVRLAFAVAAFLDAEILVIDEVLAVGDGEFQRKCLGRMHDVAQKGRTVLFVSHNMGLISSLCERGLLMSQGGIMMQGATADAILGYYNGENSSLSRVTFPDANRAARLGQKCIPTHAAIEDVKKQNVGEVGLNEEFSVAMRFVVLDESLRSPLPSIQVHDSTGQCVFVSWPRENCASLTKGSHEAKCLVPGGLLNNGTYFISIGLAQVGGGVTVEFFEKNILCINVREDLNVTLETERNGYSGSIPGTVRPRLDWTLTVL